MDTFPTYIQHTGEWNHENKFVNFIPDCIVIRSSFNYENLVAEILKQIAINVELNCIEIKFIPSNDLPPVLIYNDTGVQVYIELRKKHPDFTAYPLCVRMKEISTGAGCSNINSASTSFNCINSGKLIQQIDEAGDINVDELVDDNYTEDILIDNCAIIDDMLHEKVEENQVYQDKQTLVSVMKHYALRNKFQFKVKRSSTKRYYLSCVDAKCTWSFKSSAVGKAQIFKVRSFINSHTCSLGERYLEQRQASAFVIATMIKDKYIDPKTVYNANSIRNDMLKDHGIELTYMKAWRAKQTALEMLRGDPTESYQHLPSYLYMVEEINPGSVTRLHKSDDGRFLYTFVALNSSIQGWKYCRPTLVVDGSFLSAAHKGTFLSACTEDANGKILPLAYGIVDSENDASWEWFFIQIRYAFGVREGMCIVSDRNESILKAAATVYPDVPHCFCIYHLWNNIKAKFKKNPENLKDNFFAAAFAYTVKEFNKKMEDMVKNEPRIQDYLYRIGYEKWSRAHSKVKRPMNMTSNIAESLNSATRHARDLPVLRLLEYMYNLAQDWNDKNRRRAMSTFTELGKKYNKMLQANLVASMQLTVRSSNDDLYTVYKGAMHNTVNLAKKECNCGGFQIDELPCPHVWAVLRRNRVEAVNFCSVYYRKNFLRKTYEYPVYPMPHESAWDIPTEILEEVVRPPKGKRTPGRPKKTRYRASWEIPRKRSKLSCGVCGQAGHNKKTCRNLPKTD